MGFVDVDEFNEIEHGIKLKCTCPHCEGFGVYHGSNEVEGMAVICFYCNGRGYIERETGKDGRFYVNDTGLIIQYVDKGTFRSVELFRELRERVDIKYVTYESNNTASADFYFDNGYSPLEIISYEHFFNGMYPLPIYEYNCPARLEEHYDERKFDNGCPKGNCEECPKFGYKPCWDIYYKKVHKAKTYNKKIDLLKSFKGKKEDN